MNLVKKLKYPQKVVDTDSSKSIKDPMHEDDGVMSKELNKAIDTVLRSQLLKI